MALARLGATTLHARVVAVFFCTISACGSQVTYVPLGPDVKRNARPEEAVETLERRPENCVVQEIGRLETYCGGRARERMRAVAAQRGADALITFTELDARSTMHRPRDGNVCSATAVVFVGECR